MENFHVLRRRCHYIFFVALAFLSHFCVILQTWNGWVVMYGKRTWWMGLVYTAWVDFTSCLAKNTVKPFPFNSTLAGFWKGNCRTGGRHVWEDTVLVPATSAWDLSVARCVRNNPLYANSALKCVYPGLKCLVSIAVSYIGHSIYPTMHCEK